MSSSTWTAVKEHATYHNVFLLLGGPTDFEIDFKREEQKKNSNQRGNLNLRKVKGDREGWPKKFDFSLCLSIHVWHPKQKLKLLRQNTGHVSLMLEWNVLKVKNLWRSIYSPSKNFEGFGVPSNLQKGHKIFFLTSLCC